MGLLLLSPSLAFGWDAEVPTKDVRPTQMEIGKAHVSYSVKKIERWGPLSRALPAAIGPDGKYYISDGHHWASAADRMGVPTLRVEVSADFRGRSWTEFASHMRANGIGYFTPEVRAKYGPDQLAEMYRDHLPRSLGEMKDNPGRSVIGIALDELKIIGDKSLQDYVEFILAERFEEKFRQAGIEFNGLKESAIDSLLIGQAMHLIATDPEIHEDLSRLLRPGIEPAVAHEATFGPINAFRSASLGLGPCAAYKAVRGK